MTRLDLLRRRLGLAVPDRSRIEPAKSAGQSSGRLKTLDETGIML